MSGRLIVLSNRIPNDGPPAGGLVVALDELLTGRGGLWIGANDTPTDTPSHSLTPIPGGSGYDKAVFDITPAEYDDYYLGYANAVLWPLCHRRTDLLSLERRFAAAYAAVNARVARMIAAVVQPDDLIWVHDYHFLPVAAELRGLGVKARIGLFLHIPFPTLPDLAALPERSDFYTWLSSFDVVGLQTEADVARCFEAFRSHPAGELWFDGRVKFASRVFAVRSFPIGIDGPGFAALASRPLDTDPLPLATGTRLVLGVDRLDYSKGIPHRMRGFGTWLGNRAETSPRATLLQITPPSRSAVAAYQTITGELEALTGHLNGKHGEIDWTPIRLIERNIARETLAPLYRRADLALVTPLADGMNLVAKEFVAAQEEADPGVLILSRSAGAAEQMTDALIVNPYDADEVAETIERGLTMPLAERQERHRGLMRVVRDTDVFDWGARYIDVLSRTERQMGLRSETRSA
ncbi:alpha,alpha-trehalose-phosphate synthase (UDP-forming) [Palleronia rufa]|uniref:alpha,alpha-trehalose-phosphate synthase (UDP-forming) n=1 Tax=Palleronia rufa TaxID=1530186 RepID=UPI00056456E3|nr:trehalose-6-phosphate synthase [Palleronia rufa]